MEINKFKSRQLSWRYILFLVSFFLVAYIFPLGVRDMVVPDETRYAEIPREMIVSGDWVSPHLNGLRYFEKPVFGYWVHAVSILAFGENNFAIRFPSALSVGLSALFINLLLTLMNRREEDEISLRTTLATLIFLSCFGVFGVGNTAVLDNLFSFFMTGAIVTFFIASEANSRSTREIQLLFVSGVLCGFGFLTKGFLAFVIPVLAIVPYLIWQHRYVDLFRMGWLPIFFAVLVALPWSILIHYREPDFWHYFFWNEHIRRFMAENAQHKESFWFFFLTAPGMFLPWTFMIPAMISGLKGRLNNPDRQGRLIRLSVCWMGFPFLFFSISNGKLLTYILPCIPPFSILMAFGIIYLFDKKYRTSLFQGGVFVSTVVFFLILFVFVCIQFGGYPGFHPYSQSWKSTMAIGGLIFYLLFNVVSFQSEIITDKLLLFGVAPVALFFIVHFIIPDLTVELTTPGILLERYQKNVTDNDIVISGQQSVRAVCWYLKRDDVYVIGGMGELEYGLKQKESAGKLLDMKSATNLIARNRGKVVLVARNTNITKWKNYLPKPIFQDSSGPRGFVFWRY